LCIWSRNKPESIKIISLQEKEAEAIRNDPHVHCGMESTEMLADESNPWGNPWAPTATVTPHSLDVLVCLESIAVSDAENMAPHSERSVQSVYGADWHHPVHMTWPTTGVGVVMQHDHISHVHSRMISLHGAMCTDCNVRALKFKHCSHRHQTCSPAVISVAVVTLGHPCGQDLSISLLMDTCLNTHEHYF
jgi:hypothetical protein